MQKLQVLIIIGYLCLMLDYINRAEYIDKLLSYRNKDLIK